jgi:hypothetical protein
MVIVQFNLIKIYICFLILFGKAVAPCYVWKGAESRINEVKNNGFTYF